MNHAPTLQSVTPVRKRFVTPCSLRRITVRRMDESWRQYSDDLEPQPRIRWARINRTEYDQAVAAAESLAIPPGTYRTYEHPKADGGRRPPLEIIQRIARKFGVSWHWLASGEGSPDDKPANPLGEKLVRKLDELPPEKQEAAAQAVMSVLDAIAKSA